MEEVVVVVVCLDWAAAALMDDNVCSMKHLDYL